MCTQAAVKTAHSNSNWYIFANRPKVEVIGQNILCRFKQSGIRFEQRAQSALLVWKPMNECA